MNGFREFFAPRFTRTIWLALAIFAALSTAGCGEFEDFDYEPYPIITSNGDPRGDIILDVPFYRQQDQVWCWAAVEEMVLDHYGQAIPQQEIVRFTFNAVYSTTATLPQIQYGLRGIGGLLSEIYPSPLNADQIRQQLASGYPIIASYNNSFAGHVVVLFGIDTRNNVYIHDPIYGSVVVPLGASYYYGAQGGPPYVWANSIVNIRELY